MAAQTAHTTIEDPVALDGQVRIVPESVRSSSTLVEPGLHGTAEAVDALEADSLILNLDASLRVHTRAQFFRWTQGFLQSLIRHEVLLCVLRDGKPGSFRADAFSMNAPQPAVLADMFLHDPYAGPGLIKAWRDRRFRPFVLDAGEPGTLMESEFGAALRLLGCPRILVHGTHDADGQVASFFAFACVAGLAESRYLYQAQLAIPSLHAAWVRVQMDGNGQVSGTEGPKRASIANITGREQEILRWIALGKSNIEIGAILGISPLTVKNHVQKILRKLNVVNRTQAIAKALHLRILSS